MLRRTQMVERPVHPETNATRLVVIAPTFNNSATLIEVLDNVSRLGLTVIAVDDGSLDETPTLLSGWCDPSTGRHVVTHPINRGKASALQSGFAEARRLGFTHAATIDTDGQHDPLDLVSLRALVERHADAIIVGIRPIDTANYPTKSRVGRRVSNLMVRLLGGIKVADSQCGLRVYPLAVLELLQARAARYAFETEVLIRAGWANVEVIESPIRCIYFDGPARVTHFKPWRDSLSATWMHIKLIARSLWPVPARKCRPSTHRTHTGTIIERGLRWMNPMPTLRAARRDPKMRDKFARSVGAGVFSAFLPPMGFKTVLCLAVSRLFRLQPTIVVAVSSLQTPPIGLIFAFISLNVGHLLLAGTLVQAGEFDFQPRSLPRLIGFGIACWSLGGVVSGAIVGLSAYLIARSGRPEVTASDAIGSDAIEAHGATEATAMSGAPSQPDTH